MRFAILKSLIKQGKLEKITLSFFVIFFGISAVITFVDPSIEGYGQGLWYSFASVTTIGYGDVVATTPVAKVGTVIIAVSGILYIAAITGIYVNFINEVIRLRTGENISVFFDKLTRLETLSEEELKELSAQVRKYRKEKRK